MSISSGPIGIFDSGVGGLTVLKALRERMPDEQYVYLGDTARLPYGTKTSDTVRRYALNAAAHLNGHRVKLLVVACNTASSFALDEVAAASPVPVVGVVQPGVRTALLTGADRIGVIGTEGTIRSAAYQKELGGLGPAVEVRIAGRAYRIRSDADPAWLQRVARQVDEAMTLIRDRTETVDTLEIAVLTALNLAREILLLREQLADAREVEIGAGDRGVGDVSPDSLRALIELAESALEPADRGA